MAELENPSNGRTEDEEEIDEPSALHTFARDFLAMDPDEPIDAAEIKVLHDAVWFLTEISDAFIKQANLITRDNFFEKFISASDQLRVWERENDALPVNEHFAIQVLPFMAIKSMDLLNEKLPKSLRMDRAHLDTYIAQFARHLWPEGFGLGRFYIMNLADILDFKGDRFYKKTLNKEEQTYIEGLAARYVGDVYNNGGEHGIDPEIVKIKFAHNINIAMGLYPFGWNREGENCELTYPLEFLLDPSMGDPTERRKITPEHMAYLKRAAAKRMEIMSQTEEPLTKAQEELYGHLRAVAEEGYLHFGYTVEGVHTEDAMQTDGVGDLPQYAKEDEDAFGDMF